MKKNASVITVHMVSSLDGFIAKKDGSIAWMQSNDTFEKGLTLSEDEVAEFIGKIDCYVMGSRTYEDALELGWPYGDLPVFVLTTRNLASHGNNVEFHSRDLSALVNNRLKMNYKNIWVVGGAVIAKEIIRLNLADEIVISIMPVILGDGTPFFDHIGLERRLHLKDVTAYRDGMVEMCYEIIKGN